MKYHFLFPLLILFFSACESTSQEAENKTAESPKPAFANLNVEQFKELMNEPNVVILDVRTPEETAEGMIEGAIQIDFQDPSFDQKISALDKEKTYLVYCAAGGRSAKSCDKMADQGFKHLYNLDGGYDAWSETR